MKIPALPLFRQCAWPLACGLFGWTALAATVGAQAPLAERRDVRVRGGSGPIDYSQVRPVTGQTAGELAVFGERQPDGSELVDIEWNVLKSLVPDAENRISLTFEGERLELVLVQHEQREPNRFTWIGQIAGIAFSDVILVRHDDAVFLTVRDYTSKRGPIEMHATLDGLHRIRRVDPNQGLCGGSPKWRPATANAKGVGPQTANLPSSPHGGHAMTTVSDPDHVIDIMIVPSDAALSGAGGESGFISASVAMVADLNLHLANSGSPLFARLCAVPFALSAGYSESQNMSTELDRVSYQAGQIDSDTGSEYDPDGYLDEIQNQRDTYRPDLVALIVENTNNSTIGIAWVVGGGLSNFGESGGYSVTQRSVAVSTGTFAHEIGHNLGACHNAEQNNCVDEPVVDYNKGIARQCLLDEWRTVMSYPTTIGGIGSNRVPYFSTQGITVEVTEPVFGAVLCTLEMWDQGSARVTDMIDVTRSTIADYDIALTQMWADASPGTYSGEGTHFEPFDTFLETVQSVAGGATMGVAKARAGTYTESASLGGPQGLVLQNPCTIEAVGGSVTIQ